MRLNKAKKLFTTIKYCKIKNKYSIAVFIYPTVESKIAYIIAAISPNRKFVKIPEIETNLMPFLYFLKFKGLIGTGFAQPMPNKTNIRNPPRLKCLNGLSVSLPISFGVGSPILYAVNEWANSCKVSDIR